MDKRLSITLDATWREGTLTYNDFTLEYKSELPLQIPRYELDTSVRIELDDKPTLSGIYLPILISLLLVLFMLIMVSQYQRYREEHVATG